MWFFDQVHCLEHEAGQAGRVGVVASVPVARPSCPRSDNTFLLKSKHSAGRQGEASDPALDFMANPATVLTNLRPVPDPGPPASLLACFAYPVMLNEPRLSTDPLPGFAYRRHFPFWLFQWPGDLFPRMPGFCVLLLSDVACAPPVCYAALPLGIGCFGVLLIIPRI